MLRIIIALFLIFTFQISEVSSDSLSVQDIGLNGRKYTEWFFESKLDIFIEHIVNKDFTFQELKDFKNSTDRELGKETKTLNERMGKSNNGLYYYLRYSKFSNTDNIVKTAFGFTVNDSIYIFTVDKLPEEAPTKYSGYKTKTFLRLPFEGQWFVSSGGRNIYENHHTVSIDQRFAYDFVIMNNGLTFMNDGAVNEDYYCFDKEILSPGTGIVIKVVNDVNDNIPGEKQDNAGNYVIIDHGNNEYTVLAHMKKGSITVRVGEKVDAGQFLGRCGNSGNSTEAHLHYHVQNSPILFEGEGLPVQFNSYISDKEEILQGEPVWGQILENR